MTVIDPDFIVVIPARYASTRLPGKPLLQIGDKSLIHHVCQQASNSKASQVIVATDEQKIANHVSNCGFTAVMTSPDCESGTDRIAQAVSLLQTPDDTIVINLQGDEPFMPAKVIDQLASQLSQHAVAKLSTACERLVNQDDWNNPDIVKVVANANNEALYFSRSLIPYMRDQSHTHVYKHLGIYAYTVKYIKEFASMPACALELTEKLEQLRALWFGHTITLYEVTQPTGIGVDTPEDLEQARLIYKESQHNG